MKSAALALFCPAATCADSSALGAAPAAGTCCGAATAGAGAAGAGAAATGAAAATKDAYFGFFARFSSTETSLSPYTMTCPVLSSRRDEGAVYGGKAGAAGRAAAPGGGNGMPGTGEPKPGTGGRPSIL
jgi:hypothetical protein